VKDEECRFRAALGRCLGHHATVSHSQAEALYRHYRLLCRWNRVVNLTAIEELEEAVERHYAEAIYLSGFLGQGESRVADLGAGAGFPGLPVAVVRPECEVHLVEAGRKKCTFLKEAARDLANVHVRQMRWQDLSERFDWVLSRAVSAKDLATSLPRLGARFAVLASEGAWPAWRAIPGTDWAAPVRLPWGRRRALLLGWSVPRETSGDRCSPGCST